MKKSVIIFCALLIIMFSFSSYSTSNGKNSNEKEKMDVVDKYIDVMKEIDTNVDIQSAQPEVFLNLIEIDPGLDIDSQITTDDDIILDDEAKINIAIDQKKEAKDKVSIMKVQKNFVESVIQSSY